jgi:catechol 2,3-dioxygenase-like lactoylglutathione lyase family enzyme
MVGICRIEKVKQEQPLSIQAPKFTWGHININVSNLDRSIEFYAKLGFEVFIPAIPYLGLKSEAVVQEIQEAASRALGLAPNTRGRACIMQLGSGFPKVDLTEISAKNQKKPLANSDLGLVRICLASQDLQKDYVYLRERGVEFILEPQSCKDGMAEIATCHDPDGTLIELIQVYLEKWPIPGRSTMD